MAALDNRQRVDLTCDCVAVWQVLPLRARGGTAGSGQCRGGPVTSLKGTFKLLLGVRGSFGCHLKALGE